MTERNSVNPEKNSGSDFQNTMPYMCPMVYFGTYPVPLNSMMFQGGCMCPGAPSGFMPQSGYMYGSYPYGMYNKGGSPFVPFPESQE